MQENEAKHETERWNASMRRRMTVCFYGLCFGIALPLAVFTTNGLLGLIVHGFALSGAATLFEKPAQQPKPGDAR